MGFEVFNPSPPRTPPIPLDQMTIGKRGLCNFPEQAIEELGISDAVTVLFDAETKLIALRRPHRGETPMKLTAVKGRACLRVNLRAVFKAMGVEPKPGRRKTTVSCGMLVFSVEE